MARQAASSSAGSGDKTCIIEPPEVLALSPERRRCPDRCGGSERI
jgi:hypothetical protein